MKNNFCKMAQKVRYFTKIDLHRRCFFKNLILDFRILFPKTPLLAAPCNITLFVCNFKVFREDISDFKEFAVQVLPFLLRLETHLQKARFSKLFMNI